MFDGSASLYAAVAVIGLIHGAEPGHGWPVAAAYALDRSRTWAAGLLAGLVIGVGHLISSIAVVAAFLLAASYFQVTDLWWVRYVAGVLLIALGIREYYHGHEHGHDHSSAHEHSHDHEQDYDDDHDGSPGSGGTHGDGRDHRGHDDGPSLAAEDPRGLAGLASTAFVLGFAHEEEFEILAFCTGAADRCVELMVVYALAVIVALVALTLLLVGGYERYEQRVGRYADYLPTVSAAVLILMGVGFLVGVL